MDSWIARRRLVATILAVVLAAETVGVVAASVPGDQAAQPPAAGAAISRVLDLDATLQLPAATPADPGPAAATPEPSKPAATPATPDATPDATPAPRATPEPTAKPPKAAKPKAEPTARPKPRATPKPAPKATPKPRSAGTGRVSAADFKGTNHVWIPALGINKAVQPFACDRNRPPDNHMYRWGCAGDNNVYLMGHAYSVMEPLHDAYYSGRLRAGMKAYYAGANGKVHVYAVRWWKKTLPTPDASWAWAPQAVPSMTLQTCVGKNSQYRLMVRLVEVDG